MKAETVIDAYAASQNVTVSVEVQNGEPRLGTAFLNVTVPRLRASLISAPRVWRPRKTDCRPGPQGPRSQRRADTSTDSAWRRGSPTGPRRPADSPCTDRGAPNCGPSGSSPAPGTRDWARCRGDHGGQPNRPSQAREVRS